jgi:8-oxo-dGTP pyrophosphatase MutT (NUDIX family)
VEADRGLIELLDRHQPAAGKEAADLERMRAFARALEQPFSREQAAAHFTASAILVDAAHELTCLVHHRKLDKWLQPGGHFEPEDEGDLLHAAGREVLEETGCHAIPIGPIPADVDIHVIPARGAAAEHLHLDLRIVMVAADRAQLRYDSAESHDAQWLDWATAERMAGDDALKRALRKARAILNR